MADALDHYRAFIDGLNIGDKLRLRWTTNHSQLFHVRGVVDGHAVVRWWTPRKGWVYDVRGPIWFMVNEGHLKVHRKRRKADGRYDDTYDSAAEEVGR